MIEQILISIELSKKSRGTCLFWKLQMSNPGRIKYMESIIEFQNQPLLKLLGFAQGGYIGESQTRCSEQRVALFGQSFQEWTKSTTGQLKKGKHFVCDSLVLPESRSLCKIQSSVQTQYKIDSPNPNFMGSKRLRRILRPFSICLRILATS